MFQLCWYFQLIYSKWPPDPSHKMAATDETKVFCHWRVYLLNPWSSNSKYNYLMIRCCIDKLFNGNRLLNAQLTNWCCWPLMSLTLVITGWHLTSYLKVIWVEILLVLIILLSIQWRCHPENLKEMYSFFNELWQYYITISILVISWGRSELTDRNVELYPQFFLELHVITTQVRFYMVSPQLLLLSIILTI